MKPVRGQVGQGPGKGPAELRGAPRAGRAGTADPAFAKGGRKRYGLAPDTRARFERCLSESTHPDLPLPSRTARTYLDILFFHSVRGRERARGHAGVGLRPGTGGHPPRPGSPTADHPLGRRRGRRGRSGTAARNPGHRYRAAPVPRKACRDGRPLPCSDDERMRPEALEGKPFMRTTVPLVALGAATAAVTRWCCTTWRPGQRPAAGRPIGLPELDPADRGPRSHDDARSPRCPGAAGQ